MEETFKWRIKASDYDKYSEYIQEKIIGFLLS